MQLNKISSSCKSWNNNISSSRKVKKIDFSSENDKIITTSLINPIHFRHGVLYNDKVEEEAKEEVVEEVEVEEA